ncbi:Replication factor C subunit 1 [Morella rubra]|uniref:Replication factor C subunit 1 n=1 Tax=Morella rubra TaxID=262757 RepID=A0A6A1VUF2_9ROSI|nr:Replication factor C subunit 1 [Morella rubra]
MDNPRDAQSSKSFNDITQKNFMQLIYSAEYGGRVLKYNLETKETTVLMRSLQFPNGVSLSKDGSFFVFCEGAIGRWYSLARKFTKSLGIHAKDFLGVHRMIYSNMCVQFITQITQVLVERREGGTSEAENRQSDIRKWFMKSHVKGNGRESKPANPAPNNSERPTHEGQESSGRRRTSKYFDTTKQKLKDEEETEELSAKRKTRKDSNESLKPPPSKKVHKVDDDDEDFVLPSSRNNSVDVTPRKKFKSGLGRGISQKSVDDEASDEDDDKDIETPQVSSGRGRGGRGSSAASAGGRGRGGGRGGFMNFGERKDPPHKGEKEVPEGASDCLAGLTFVISGTLDSLEREEAEDLIKRHGGRVTGSVSKRTNYLLCDEDIGGRKSGKAKELGAGTFHVHQAGTKPMRNIWTLVYGSKDLTSGAPPAKHKNQMLGENALTWTEKYKPKVPNDIIGNQSLVKQLHDWLSQWNEQFLDSGTKKKGKKQNDSGTKKAVLLSGTPGIGKTTSAKLVSQMLGFQAIEVNASDSRGKADSKIEKGVGGSNANSIKELVNNEALSVKMDGIKQPKPVLIMDEVDGMSAGDRGGIADLIASIKISKIPIICICNDRYSQKLKSLVNYCLLLSFRKPTKQQILSPMEGKRRWRVKERWEWIRACRRQGAPGIGILMATYSTCTVHVGEMGNSSSMWPHLVLVRADVMAKRLMQVASAEGLQVNEIALEELAERVNGDMRMALNQLQYLSLSMSVFNSDDIRQRLLSSAKDEDISPFTAVDKLFGFNAGKLRMDQRIDLSMSDPDLVPLLIQENYINYKPSLVGKDDDGIKRMNLIARAAESIGDGDIINVQIRRYRQWQLSQSGSLVSCIIPAALLHGQRETLEQGERNFNRFGGWLGKNSTMGKNLRLMEDLHVHLLASRESSSGRETLRVEYLTLLLKRLTEPLRVLPKDEAVQKVVEFMNIYSISQEDFDTIVELSKFKGHPNPLDGIQPAVKAALTKAYKEGSKSRMVRAADLVTLPGMKKAPKKRIAAILEPADDVLVDGDGGTLAENEEENSSDTEELEGPANSEKLQLELQSLNSKGMQVELDLKGTGNSAAKKTPAGRGKSGSGPTEKKGGRGSGAGAKRKR